MFRQISGPLIFHSKRLDLKDTIGFCLDVINRFLPILQFSHFFVNRGLDGRYMKFSKKTLTKSLDDPKLLTVDVASFRDNSEANAKTDWQMRIAISTANSRADGCRIITLGFGEEIVISNLTAVIEIVDQIATHFRIDSGHLHDVEDFADQNQRSPHYFKITGKSIDPAKIKYSNTFGQEIVDVEQNPCHLHVFGYVDYTAAWTVLIGERALDEITVAAMKALEGEVQQLDRNLYRVTLFDNPFMFNTKDNIDRLWRFRKTLGIDDVAHKHVPQY